MRECLRDRRTIVTLIAMPLLLYPLLSILFQRYLLAGQMARVAHEIIIAVPDEVTGRYIGEQLILADQFLRDASRTSEQRPAVGVLEFQPSQLPQVMFKVSHDLEEDVLENVVDVGIRVRPQTQLSASASSNSDPLHQAGDRPFMTWEFVARDGSIGSNRAMEFISGRLEALNDAYIQRRLIDLGDSGRSPYEIELNMIGSRDDTGAVSLAMVIPLVLILMTMTGAIYPAIDCTAGERERGTLEAVIATPVPRFALLLAKYMAVVAVSVLTATVNLIAMSVTLAATGLGAVLLGGNGISVKILLATLLLLVIFSFFFSAMVLAVSSVARSFKEAQAYLIPLMLVSLAPSLMSLAPGVHLGPKLAVVPLINLVLLAKAIFAGQNVSSTWLLAVGSSVLYALAAIAMAARVFGSDAVLYGSDVTWRDVVKRPRPAGTHLGSYGAIVLSVALLPTYILLSGTVQHWPSIPLGGKLAGMAGIAAFLFVIIPSLVAWHQRLQIRECFGITHPMARHWMAAICLGLATWPLALWIAVVSGSTQSFSSQYEQGRELVEQLRHLPWWVLATCLVVLPAIMEEFFFRGMLLRSLRGETSSWRAILVSACLFGVFHVVGGVFAVERFLPSTFVGLLLGWIAVKSDSSIPGMVVHALHNGILVTLAYYESSWSSNGNWLEGPFAMGVGLCASLVLLLLVAWMLRMDPVRSD